MLTRIAGITLAIFLIVAIGFVYSRAVKPDLAGANKLVVGIPLMVLAYAPQGMASAVSLLIPLQGLERGALALG